MTQQSAGGAVIIEGDLTIHSAAEFERRMRSLNAASGGAVTLDLSGLDIEDGVALATAINSLRELRNRSAKIILKGAPQMLCHNLYRVGLLGEGGVVELVDMRLDEPAGF
ncbi:MAG TPA: STAS domain-containing protein [Blastocatellia bacterium]|nr:STAS domain-containing protein [Blastocatellia bacterium]